VTKTAQKVMVGMAIAIGTVGASRAEAADRELGMPNAPVVMRVRTNTVALAILIQRATERSTTFRGLVETINASDGIVYVNEGECGHGVRACLVAVSAAGPNRILWVKVDTRKADWDLMASVGHELCHAVEVLGNPTVTSNAALYFFYARIGHRGTKSSFETQAAVQAGHAVRTEVRRPTVIAQVQ
jgi:hypothetical protein